MSNLAHRQSLIQAKRKQTPWRNFVMEICSWQPIMFYKNNGILSKYPDTKRSPKIIATDIYNSKGVDIVESIYNSDFYQSFLDLYKTSTLSATYQFAGLENVGFSDITHDSRDVYLSIMTTTGSRQVMYSISTKQNSSQVFNSLGVAINSENTYQSACCTNSYNIFFSKNIHNSNNMRFCSNCVGCNDCILCDDLENASYHISNKQYSKEEFIAKKLEILKEKEKFNQYFSIVLSNPFNNYQSPTSSGVGLLSCGNVLHSLFGNNIHGGNNNILIASNISVKNSYDGFLGGSGDTYDMYGQIGSGLCNNIYCTIQGGTCSFIFYSMFLESCSFCLGCIGLKNKSYCILNKQYTKEERYEKVDEIFSQMEKDGTLGEFFPASMNPFYFNDTAAYLIDPSFTKEEVTARGYLRRDEPIKVDIPEGAKVVKTSELDRFESRESPSPSEGSEVEGAVGTWKVDPEILKYIIQDEQGNVYRIVKMEYDFLMKHGLPLPRKHWLDRMKENFRIH